MRTLLFLLSFALTNVAGLNGEELLSFGTVTSPLGDCLLLEKDGRLRIVVPGTEKPHGLTAELQSMDAPRVLRPVKEDFTIEVKAAGVLDPGTIATEAARTPYVAGGLVAMLDDKNYVTLVRAALQRGSTAYPYANFEIRVNGECVQLGNATAHALKLDQPCSLRLSRRGNQFLAWISDDGQTWDALEPKEAPPEWGANLQAGIVAISNSRNEFTAGFSELKLDPQPTQSRTSAAAAPVNPYQEYVPLDNADDAAACKRNLEKINTAILAYRKDHKDIPNWLSDLVPKYLPDGEALICSVTKKTDRLSPFGALDPEKRCSYLYEFCPTPMTETVKSAFAGPSRANRDWKRQQMGVVGSAVPIVRCLLHNPVLNLSFGGKIYESPLFWEQNFMDVTTMEALSPK